MKIGIRKGTLADLIWIYKGIVFTTYPILYISVIYLAQQINQSQ